MPTNRPTEDEVRGLMAEYGEPSAPECPSCHKPMAKEFCPDGEHWFVCHVCHESELVETKHDPDVIAVCEELLRLREGETKWTQELPTENGEYWHWCGDEDSAPLPMFVLGSGTPSGKCFVSQGQLGITEAIDCDEFGGWWKRLITPELPSKELRKQAKPKKKRRQSRHA